MDFLKSCSTNVHAIEDLHSVRYRRLDHATPNLCEADEWTRLHDALAALRQQNVLCSCSDGELYVFDSTQYAPRPTPELFNTAEEDLLDYTSAKQTAGGTLLRHVFLDAIEGGISFGLAKEQLVVHVAPWTWICCTVDEECDQHSSHIMTLYHRLTPTGSLYLILEIKPTRHFPLSGHAQPDQDVVVAPSGTMAKTISLQSDHIIDGPFWKSSVSRALASEGVHLADDVDWAAIQPLHGPDINTFLWPSALLLAPDQPPNVNLSSAETIDPGHSWRSWFSESDSSKKFRNPLSIAEEWFNESAARAQLAAVSQSMSAHEIPTAAPDQMANTLGEDTDMTSPPFTQRSIDQQAAIAGIYPTPPDGVNQGQQTFQSIPVTTPSLMQGEQGYTIAEQLLTGDDSQVKAQDFPPTLDAGGFPMEQDELFGDSGDMEFEDNDIGDADFSFFDEPDDEPLATLHDDCGMPGTLQTTDDQIQPPELSTEDLVGAAAKEEPGEEAPEDIALPLEDKTLQSHNKDGPVFEQDATGPNIPMLAPEFEGHVHTVEKPLDPFGIRERLLPPPVPASVAQNDFKNTEKHHRNSTFAPIVFRESLRLDPKYEVRDPEKEKSTSTSQSAGPNISLTSMRKKTRQLKKKCEREYGFASDDSEIEEGSYESSSSDTDENLPPKLPWDNRKRKRHTDLSYNLPDSATMLTWPEDETSDYALRESSKVLALLKRYLARHEAETHEHVQAVPSSQYPTYGIFDRLPAMEEFYNLRKEDLMYIAQIVQEQAATNFDQTSWTNLESISTDSEAVEALACEKAVSNALNRLFAQCGYCDLAKISLARDPQPPQRAASGTGKGPQGQPRPLQRPDNLIVGPDYFPLQPPYVKIQRGTDSWEMLSTCLSFWETLGLGPANGTKGVRAFCVFPSNDDLQGLIGHFLTDLGMAYESCKLGSHAYLRNANGDDELDNYEDGMAPVELEPDTSLEAALKAYAATCTELGEALSYISHHEADRTIVVYMVNPFPGHQAKQHLCACFWMLFKAYRDNLPKTHRSHCGSDVVLQIVPIQAIAHCDMLVVPDAKQMATLAREVYDRCPPPTAAQAADNTSTLPILAAPSVQLAASPPKRIGFQLVPDPPNDLLHECSILHIAYACSVDRQWMTAAWLDNTGQYYSTAAFSLRGRSFSDGSEDLWERTREIIASRQVTWRIFIVTSGGVDKSVIQCWRALSSKPRQQPLCVTMLSVRTHPELRLLAPDPQGLANNDQGFLTPASTPQATTFTSSPDVNNHTNAPPTPAPSETAISLADNDPDAHLIDVTDESWGVMLSPKLINLASFTGLANGILLRRKEVEPQGGDEVSSLGVNLHWTIQVKPGGNVDEGSVKQAELTLREVLRMYRNLSLLTKAKGLDEGITRMAPLHVAAAIRGVKWLDGMLPME